MKNAYKQKRGQGFTIIEVMIVLAIAGLILAIIFLAVPALQRNTRNNSRKNDATHLAGLVSEYAGNHAGVLPTVVGAGAGQMDLTNEHWAIMTAPVTANLILTNAQGSLTSMNVNKGFTCDPSTNALTTGNSHSFSISFQIETSSTTQNYCIPGS